MSLPTNIYWLTADGIPFYAGKTIFDPTKRLRDHIKDSRRYPDRKISRAIVARRGMLISVELKETVSPCGNWQERERFWIAELRRSIADVANSADGGQGSHGHKHSAFSRAKMSVRAREKLGFNRFNDRDKRIEELADILTLTEVEKYRRKCRTCSPAPIVFPVEAKPDTPRVSRVSRKVLNTILSRSRLYG